LNLDKLCIILNGNKIFDRFSAGKNKEILDELRIIKKSMKKSKSKIFKSWYLSTTLNEINKKIGLYEIYSQKRNINCI